MTSDYSGDFLLHASQHRCGTRMLSAIPCDADLWPSFCRYGVLLSARVPQFQVVDSMIRFVFLVWAKRR